VQLDLLMAALASNNLLKKPQLLLLTTSALSAQTTSLLKSKEQAMVALSPLVFVYGATVPVPTLQPTLLLFNLKFSLLEGYLWTAT
jgi:hypothetical protein